MMLTVGHREAPNSLGNLLWGCGDLEGAKSAFQRSIPAGSDRAALNLGLLLAQEGVVEEALQHLRSAEEKGFPEGAWAIGCLLDGRDDLSLPAGSGAGAASGAPGNV